MFWIYNLFFFQKKVKAASSKQQAAITDLYPTLIYITPSTAIHPFRTYKH
jgi:hypothetical protein